MLIKNARDYEGRICDYLIADGKIRAIGTDLPEAGGIPVADGAVECERRLVCGCDDGEDLSAALPAQQLLHAGIELPPDAAVLRLVGEIAGDFGVPRIGSALKGAPGIAVA